VTTSSKDVLQGLTDKLRSALDEVQQIKQALLASPEVGRVRDELSKGARVAADEASRVYEQLGRETYRLVKTGGGTVPEVIRETFQWAEQRLERFSEEEAAAGEAEPSSEPVVEAAPEPEPADEAAPEAEVAAAPEQQPEG